MVGVVCGTPLGVGLAARLVTDGRAVRDVRLSPRDGAAAMAELSELAAAARLIVVDAEPAALPELARALGEVLDGNHLVAHTVRGLTPSGASALTVLRHETAVRRLGVIAGPLTATDLAAGRPAAAVVAARHPEVVEEFAAALSTPHLRVYRGHDPLGVELASSVGDVVAVGCGVARGLGFGDTTRSMMLVRSVRELGRLIAACGGEPTTAGGLAGLGDLLVRAVEGDPAFQLGVGLAHAAALAPPALVASARGLAELARRQRVAAHILDGLARLLAGDVQPLELVRRLMALPVLDD
jgi:glycerol-3-phosphate dehydrogenase (NAD(P)+)